MKQAREGQVAVYSSSVPTYTDGESAGLQVDVNGQLKTVPSGAGTTGATAPTTATEMGGVYNTTPPTLSNGQLGALQVDSKGNLKVVKSYSYSFISTASTTVVKSGSGVLHSITVGGGNSFAMIVYDNTAASGSQIASFGTFATTDRPSSYVFDLAFSTGLTILTDGSCRVTVTYL